MICFSKKFLFSIFSLLLIAYNAYGQQGPAVGNPQLAGLMQDMVAMQRALGQVQLELEVLRRENVQLLELVQAIGQKGPSELQALKKSFETTQTELKRQILTEVTTQLDLLAKQAQQPSSTPSSTKAEVKFTDDYPKEGVIYEVKPGDTLSKIAQVNHSSIRDIQNANCISDPKSLKVGQTLFIPQKN